MTDDFELQPLPAHRSTLSHELLRIVLEKTIDLELEGNERIQNALGLLPKPVGTIDIKPETVGTPIDSVNHEGVVDAIHGAAWLQQRVDGMVEVMNIVAPIEDGTSWKAYVRKHIEQEE